MFTDISSSLQVEFGTVTNGPILSQSNKIGGMIGIALRIAKMREVRAFMIPRELVGLASRSNRFKEGIGPPPACRGEPLKVP